LTAIDEPPWFSPDRRFRNVFESSKFFDGDPAAVASLAGFIVNIRLLGGPAGGDGGGEIEIELRGLLEPAGGDGGGEAARAGSCCAFLSLIDVREAASSSPISDSSVPFGRQHAAVRLISPR
jgi:hypothetical protein